MHFEILVEGQTELTALSILMKSIAGEYKQPHTWRIHKHRGIGKLPDDPAAPPRQHDQTLLHNLPSKLRAYGRENRDNLVVVVLADLDDRTDCREFKSQMVSVLDSCPEKPNALFRIAIEELEAWFLGDQKALKTAYPKADQSILDSYEQDSQCGTWELLANAVHPGGVKALKDLGRRAPQILEIKKSWTKEICPHMDVESNQSPSFQVFRDGIRRAVKESP